MNRILATLTAAALAAATNAQCYTNGAGTQVTAWGWTFTNDDGVSTNHIPLGFAFPIAGAAAPSFTHVRIGSNGWLMLTDGTLATGLPGNSNYGSVAALAGAAGEFPIVAPFWGDLFWTTGATNGVFVENNATSCKISWRNVRDYSAGAASSYSFAVELFATGEVQLSYNGAVENVTTQGFTNHVGVSCRNGVAIPAASDLVPGPTVSAGGMVFEGFPLNTFDGEDKTLSFTPAGAGWVAAVTCQAVQSSHTSYGAGCYQLSDSVYSSFATAGAAAPVLANTAITFTPTPSGGYVLSSGGSFLPVGSVQATPTIVAVGDDTEQFVPFTTGSFPGAGGIAVCSNGFVSLATGNDTTWNVNAALMLNDPQTSFRSAHDMNPTLAGSGQIKHEESAAVTMVTWDGVWDYAGSSVADANNIQIQLYPNGTVVIAWGALSPLGASGIGYVVGYSPGGASLNGGSIDLTTALPVTVLSTAQASPMALAASPNPVSTAISGTLVTYTQSNIPEAAPASSVYLGLTILSLGQDLPGTDLGFLGMPGCSLHLASLDAQLPFIAATNSVGTLFPIPAGITPGTTIYVQSAALITPNSLPNGQNAFGAVLSNAVKTTVGTF